MIMTRARRLANMATLNDVRELSIVGLRGMLADRRYYCANNYPKSYVARIRASVKRKIALIRACDHALRLLDFANDGPDVR